MCLMFSEYFNLRLKYPKRARQINININPSITYNFVSKKCKGNILALYLMKVIQLLKLVK